MNDHHILQMKEGFDTDESIRRYEYNEYTPITGTNLNTTGEIRIILESQDEFFHVSGSYLVVQGQLLKTTDAAYGDGDNISLINNGIMYLFSNIKYELSGHEIENINYPGPATTMKGLLKYSEEFAKGAGMNQCWTKDNAITADIAANVGFAARHNYIIKKPTPKGSFTFAIPLKHIFGFCEDYDRVLYGLRHVLTMVRQGDDEVIFRKDDAAAGKVVLSNISWHMPRVLPNDQERLQLLRVIETKTPISVGFRVHQCDTISVNESTTFSWRLSVRTSPECPRWVVVGFQTDKAGSQEKNPAIFDNCKAKNVWIELNGNAYPSLSHNTDFDKQQIATIYNAISEFLPEYYGITGKQSDISPIDFKELYPLFVINISKQPERTKYGVMDMNLKANFREAVKANTQAFTLVISDRILNFQSDGSKMNVVL